MLRLGQSRCIGEIRPGGTLVCGSCEMGRGDIEKELDDYKINALRDGMRSELTITTICESGSEPADFGIIYSNSGHLYHQLFGRRLQFYENHSPV